MAIEESPFKDYVGKACHYGVQNGLGITGILTEANHSYLEFKPFIYGLPDDTVVIVDDSARINVTNGRMIPILFSLEELVRQSNEENLKSKKEKTSKES